MLEGITYTVGGRWTNWSRNSVCFPTITYYPTNKKEVVEILKFANETKRKVAPVGSGHTPNGMPACNDIHLNMTHMARVLSIDPDTSTATVEGGCTLLALSEALSANELQLCVLPSVADITLAGAIANGTHGTGVRYPVIAELVTNIEFVSGDGRILRCSASENATYFRAMKCHLGALGVITELTIKVEPKEILLAHSAAFDLAGVSREMAEKDKFDHFRLMWFPIVGRASVWKASATKDAVCPSPNPPASGTWGDLYQRAKLFFASYLSTLLPSTSILVNSCMTSGLCETSQYIEKIGSCIDCYFRQWTSEWAIPSERSLEIIEKLEKLLKQETIYVHLIEARWTKGDDALLSPTQGQDTCWIGVVWFTPFNRPHAHIERFLPLFSDIMRTVGGRPHWAKEFALNPGELRTMYKEWDVFWGVQKELDPNRVFVQGYVKRIMEADEAAASSA